MRIVRLKPYLRAMKGMGLDDAAMREIEAAILTAPEAHPIIKGLRSVRKVRFARPGTGKSGGGRAIYYVALKGGLLAMLTAYPKNQKDDLSPDDRRAILRAIEGLARGPSDGRRHMTTNSNRTRLGRDLEEAFTEMAAYLRGETEAEAYEVADDVLTPERVQAIRRKVAASTKEFERQFRISARTMEAYEQGRRRPDAAMRTLLRVIDREPEAVRRALAP